MLVPGQGESWTPSCVQEGLGCGENPPKIGVGDQNLSPPGRHGQACLAELVGVGMWKADQGETDSTYGLNLARTQTGT